MRRIPRRLAGNLLASFSPLAVWRRIIELRKRVSNKTARQAAPKAHHKTNYTAHALT